MYYQVLIHINDQGDSIMSSSGTRTLNADAIDNMVVKIQDLGHIFPIWWDPCGNSKVDNEQVIDYWQLAYTFAG